METRPKNLSSHSIYSGRVLNITRDEVWLPSGKTVTREVVRHPGAIVIIPQQQDGSLLLLRQFRYALGDVLLEFPAGTLEKGEEPLACAKREIMEEVKHKASNWIALGEFYPAPGFCDELQFGFLARDLTPAPATADEDEYFEVIAMSTAEVATAIADGTLSDSKSIAIFARARFQGLL